MSPSIRDDFEAIQSSHTNIPGYTSPEDILDYNFLMLISFGSKVAFSLGFLYSYFIYRGTSPFLNIWEILVSFLSMISSTFYYRNMLCVISCL